MTYTRTTEQEWHNLLARYRRQYDNETCTHDTRISESESRHFFNGKLKLAYKNINRTNGTGKVYRTVLHYYRID